VGVPPCRRIRLQTITPATSRTATAPRMIETTGEWRRKTAQTSKTTGLMIRKARDVLLEETCRYCCR